MLAATLGVAERVEFTGRVDVKQIYPRIDVLVLTSISEGLPLVILEAAAAGIPVVSTDGACRRAPRGQPARATGALGGERAGDRPRRPWLHRPGHPEPGPMTRVCARRWAGPRATGCGPTTRSPT